MTKFSKAILGLAVAMIANLASASGFTVFDNVEQCENARATNRAVVYTPTTKAPFQGGKGWTKKTVGAGGACLGKAHVLEDGAPKNGKAVYVAEGFVYWEHTSGAFRMHDCSNPFGEIIFAGKKAEEKPVAAACVDNCNTVVTQVITHVVKEVKVCETSDGKRFEPVGGECKFEPTRANVSVKVETSIDNSCRNNGQCIPKAALTIDKKVARTDGRCVVEVAFQGSTRYIRLDPEKGTGRLMAMVVPRIDGDIDRSMPITYVGGENTILHAKSTCEAAVQGFASAQSYAPTTKRLKLPGCEFRKQV